MAIAGAGMNILAIDIGGTHVKFCTQKHLEVIRFESGPKMTPKKMLRIIDEKFSKTDYDHVSIGFPGPVVHNNPLREPFNLGKGWVKYPWTSAFHGKPMLMVNDAAMQALGSYRGGRMLFLGLGTGLGSAMVVDGVVQAMELAHLPWKKGKTYEDFLSARAFDEDGVKAWRKHVKRVIDDLSVALETDYVVLGGGNASSFRKLPPKVHLGSNELAFDGAFRLWQTPQTVTPSR
jgi:polyphosphate glucokinase